MQLGGILKYNRFYSASVSRVRPQIWQGHVKEGVKHFCNTYSLEKIGSSWRTRKVAQMLLGGISEKVVYSMQALRGLGLKFCNTSSEEKIGSSG